MGRLKKKVYTYRGKTRKWYQDYNWLFWLFALDNWLKKNDKKIKKFLEKIFVILLGIYLANALPTTIQETIANYENQKHIKEIQIQENIRLAKIRKEELERQKQEDLKNKELQKQLKLEEEQNRIKEIESEIKSQYQIGDFIIITWWNDNLQGPEPPQSCSSSGQIKKIQGEYIYGTWSYGEKEISLKYNSDVWHKCKRQEYLDVRRTEEKQKAKKEKKKVYKTWGLYPGTTK